MPDNLTQNNLCICLEKPQGGQCLYGAGASKGSCLCLGVFGVQTFRGTRPTTLRHFTREEAEQLGLDGYQTDTSSSDYDEDFNEFGTEFDAHGA
jgi:hypothetical protein